MKIKFLQKTRGAVKKAIPYLLMASSVYSCSKDDLPTKDNSFPEKNPPTKSETNSTKTLEEKIIDYNKGKIYLEESLNESFNVNDIIVRGITEETPYGLIPRKINSFSNDRKTINVSPVTIDEAMPEGGTIEFDKTFEYSDLISNTNQSQKGISLKKSNSEFDFELLFKDVVLYDFDQNLLTKEDQIKISEGKIFFNANTKAKASFEDGSVYAKFNFNSQGKFDLELNSSIPLEFQNKKEIWHNYFTPFTVPAGIPVVVLPKISVSFGAEGKLNSNISIRAEDTFTSNSEIIYSNGWTKSKETTNNFDLPLIKSQVDANAKFFTELKLDLLLYGAAGPGGSIQGYFRADLDTKENPWWTVYGGLEGKLSFRSNVLSNRIPSFEQIIFTHEEEIKNAGRPFTPGQNPGKEDLDSIMIQLNPQEGKDATATIFRYPDGTETYSGEGNGEELEVYFQNVGSGFHKINSLIKFPSPFNIPSDSEISSAKLSIYGFSNTNYAGQKPIIHFYKLNSSWDEISVDGSTMPEGDLIRSMEFPERERKWTEIDITPTFKEWFGDGNNYGIGIESKNETHRLKFYSSDHPDSEKRPKLTIYYKQ